MRGMRTLARSTSKTASTGSPRSYSRSQGRRIPSWKISVLSQALEPGSAAADVAVVRRRRREADQQLAMEDRLEDEDVLQVDAAVERDRS